MNLDRFVMITYIELFSFNSSGLIKFDNFRHSKVSTEFPEKPTMSYTHAHTVSPGDERLGLGRRADISHDDDCLHGEWHDSDLEWTKGLCMDFCGQKFDAKLFLFLLKG